METAEADGSATNVEAREGPSGYGRAPERIGARLAAARVAAGLDLTEIARETRVPLRHLRAIETDAHDELPALPYAIGFVKSFARAVGMDPGDASARFKAETSKTPHTPAMVPLQPLDERRLPPRGLVALSVAALVLLLGGLGAYGAGWFDESTPAETAVAPATTPAPPVATPSVAPPSVDASAAAGAADPTTALADSASVAPAHAKPTTTAVPDVGLAPPPVAPAVAANPAARVATGSGVTIVAGDDAWIRITHIDPATGRVASLKTGVLAKGERYDVPPGEAGARLWTGRAGALRITVAGRAVPPLGGPVETVKNVSLAPDALLARLAPPAAGAMPR